MADISELEMFDNGETGMSDSRGQNGSSRHRSRSPLRKSRSRSRSPREWRRGERNRSHDNDRERRRGVREDHRGKVRLYVCNMPYDVNWQFLKDYFKQELGSAVTFVEMYDNPDGKPAGAGVVEIKGKENAEKAIDKFDRSDMKGRKIIVREEREKDRIRHQGMGGGHMGGGGGMGGRDMGGRDMGGRDMGGRDMGGRDMGDIRGGGMNMGGSMGMGGSMNMGGSMGMGGGGMSMPNNHNISPQICQQLNIDPSNITNQVFVANLDYKVSGRKLRDIFKMAGTVVDVDLKEDKDGKSRGMCVVKFEHPVEAVQAISMFNGQMLYERTMTVKMDKMGDTAYSPQQIPNKLPSGLSGIGMGLGSGGAPVNLQQLQTGGMPGMMGAGQNLMGSMGGMSSNMGSMVGGGGMGMSNPMGMSTAGMGTGMGGMSAGMGGMGTGMGAGMGGMGAGMGGMGAGLGTGMGTTSSLNPMSSMSTSPMGMSGQGMGQMGGMSTNMGLSDMGMSNSGMGGSMGGTMGGLGDMGMGGMGSNMSSGMGSSLGGGMDRGFSLSGGMSSRGNNGGASPDSATIFVRNLPFSFSWQDLKQKFSTCGDVKYAEIKMEDGRSKGYGTVKFLSLDDARRAVNLMNGARIDGRQIEVRLNRY